MKALALDLIMRWLWIVLDLMHTKNPFSLLWKAITMKLQLSGALSPSNQIAIKDRDKLMLGKQLEFWQQAAKAHSCEDEFWKDKDVLCDLSTHSPVTSVIAGW